MQGFFPQSAVRSEKPEGLIPRCGSCGLYLQCNSPKMPPSGDGKRRIMIVGEAPGANEDKRGMPFVGNSGDYLRQTIARLGYDMNCDCLITNALICRPQMEGDRIASPSNKQIGYCRPNLINTISREKPRVVITLGLPALKSIIAPYWKEQPGAMERWVGWKIPLENHWLCPTWHPSYLLRSKDPVLDKLFSEHLEAAFNINRDPSPKPRFEDLIEILYDEREIYNALRGMDKQGGWIAFDFETNCLKPDYPKAFIASCAVSNGKRTIAYPWHGKAITATHMLLRSRRTRKIGANIKFEQRWCEEKIQTKVRRWGWDIVVAAHALDHRDGVAGVKLQSLVKLGIPTYNSNVDPYLHDNEGFYNRIKDISSQHLLFYNGMDAILEWKIGMLQMSRMGHGS